MVPSLLLMSGLALLYFGGEALVRGAVSVARQLGVSVVVVSLTVVAVGTSAPEILVNISAAMDELPDIAVGNILGSNISNMLLVLAVSTVIWPGEVSRGLLRRDIPLLLTVTILFILLAWDGHFSAVDGAGMVALLVVYVFFAIKQERAAMRQNKAKAAVLEEELATEFDGEMSMMRGALYVLGGIVTLAIGAEVLVRGAVELAAMMGVPERVVAVTIVAIGSSAPELATCVAAAIKRHADVVVGNIVGSHIFNILLGIGVPALIFPLDVNPAFLHFDMWVMAGVTLLFAACCYAFKMLPRICAVLFLFGYVAYLVAQYLSV